MIRRFGLIILLMACQGEEELVPQWTSADVWQQWNNCAAASCRSEVISSQFMTDRMLVPNWINLIEHSEEQLMQLNKLQTDHPGRIQDLCQSLSIQQVQKKCQSSAARPHLYAQGSIPKVQQIPKRRAPGPEASLVLLPMIRNSPLLKVTPLKEACQSDGDPRSCLQRKALESSKDGDSTLAAQYCQAISNQHIRWRWECHFKVAETFVSDAQIKYALAADHCSVAQEYSGRCIVALHHRLAQLAPPADSNSQGWSDILKIAEDIETYWAAKNQKKSLREELLASFWGVTLLKAYQQTEQITGDPLEYLPEYCHPHIYAAAAFRFLQQSSEVKPLPELVRELQERLEDRKARDITHHKREQRVLAISDFWMQDEPQDIDVAAIGYIGRSRRTFSVDLQEELAICLLEAAARQEDSWLSLLQKQMSSEKNAVRWTAARLLDRRR